MWKYIIALLLVICLNTANAQTNNDSNPIYLPDITITEVKETGEQISREALDRDGAKDLWEALQYTPGVTFSSGGARNDSSFKIRGFGADSVPVFVDGISYGNPFRGQSDSARMLTGDLESITVQKGYSSLLYGPNTLGGAIIMRTSKPTKELEALVQYGFEADSIFKHSASNYMAALGTKQNTFYLKGVVQYRDINHFRLSDDFEPMTSSPQQKGERLHSDSTDLKTTFMAGATPTGSFDLWGTFVYQDSDKGVSPFETSSMYSIWEWTKWTRKSYSLNSTYQSGGLSLETLAYYDKYDDNMREYSSVAHLDAGRYHTTTSYDEYIAGGRIMAGYEFNASNRLRAALSYKKEDHKGTRNEKPDIHVNEDTLSVGTEYTFKPSDPITLAGGLGFDALLPQKYWGRDTEFAKLLGVDSYTVKSENYWLLAAQLGVFYEFIDNHELRFTFARKNHFPSMSQRYSTRFGESLPNPGLNPEMANHYEFGYKGNTSRLSVNASVYYSVIEDKIATISIPDPSRPSRSVNYAKNLDESVFYGFELTGEFYASSYVTIGGFYSLNKYSIEKSVSGMSKMTYFPEVTASGYMVVMPVDWLSIIPRVSYVDKRYTDIEGIDSLDSYTLTDIKTTAYIYEYFSVSAGIENIFDVNYEIQSNFSMAGRTYVVTLTAEY